MKNTLITLNIKKKYFTANPRGKMILTSAKRFGYDSLVVKVNRGRRDRFLLVQFISQELRNGILQHRRRCFSLDR